MKVNQRTMREWLIDWVKKKNAWNKNAIFCKSVYSIR